MFPSQKNQQNLPPFKQHLAKGRTNIELREQFILADGVSQTMTAFKPKTSASSPASGSSASSLRTPQGPITKVLHYYAPEIHPYKKQNVFFYP